MSEKKQKLQALQKLTKEKRKKTQKKVIEFSQELDSSFNSDENMNKIKTKKLKKPQNTPLKLIGEDSEKLENQENNKVKEISFKTPKKRISSDDDLSQKLQQDDQISDSNSSQSQSETIYSQSQNSSDNNSNSSNNKSNSNESESDNNFIVQSGSQNSDQTDITFENSDDFKEYQEVMSSIKKENQEKINICSYDNLTLREICMQTKQIDQYFQRRGIILKNIDVRSSENWEIRQQMMEQIVKHNKQYVIDENKSAGSYHICKNDKYTHPDSYTNSRKNSSLLRSKSNSKKKL